MKIKVFQVMILLSLLLVGCSNEESKTTPVSSDKEKASELNEIGEKEDIEPLPIGVQTGIVSQDVYLEIVRYIDETFVYEKQVQDYSKQMDADRQLRGDKSFQEQYFAFWDEYNAYMRDYDMVASTAADDELMELFAQIVVYTEFMSVDLINHVKTGDRYHLDSAIEYSKLKGDAFRTLWSKMEDYGLDK